MQNKGEAGILLLAVLFVLSTISVLLYLNQAGFQPEEAIGQNELRLLALKEDAVSALVTSDTAMQLAAEKSIFDFARNSLVKTENCEKHLYPILGDECTYSLDTYNSYFQDNYFLMMKDMKHKPQLAFEITKDDSTKITANSIQNLKVYDSVTYSNNAINYLFEVWPAESKVITSCYDTGRIVDKKVSPHYGIDIRGEIDGNQVNVLAAADGKVQSICKDSCNVRTGCTNSCGNAGSYVVILHRNNFLTKYSHLDADTIQVIERQEVAAGQTIAKAGNSGYSTAPHLDFKIYSSLADLNSASNAHSPLCFMSPEATEGIAFSDDADTCRNKYGDSFDSTNPSIALLSECSISAAASDTSKIPGDALERSVSYESLIADAAAKENIPPALMKAIIVQESRFEHDARSPTGAYGLFQFTAATADSIGVPRVTACCNAEQASRGICAQLTICTPENDDRPVPQTIIPYAAALLGKYWEQYSGNVELIAAAWNAGPGVANNMVQECPEGITPENAAECAKDAGKEYYSDWETKYNREVYPYLNNVRIYYDAWGGPRTTAIAWGSYYEVNPSHEINLPYDLRRFDTIEGFVDDVKKICEDEECVKEIVNDYNSGYSSSLAPIRNQIPSLCHPDRQKFGLALDYRNDWEAEFNTLMNFIADFEECKQYDWEELNETECSCNIRWPELDEIDVKILSDRIQAIKGGKVIFEHLTTLNNARIEWGGEIIERGYYFDNGFTKNIRDERGDDLRLQKNPLPLTRDEEGIILKETAQVCEAKNKLYSFCYNTGLEVPELNAQETSYGLTEVVVPFSIKLD